jgi:hypothetical protein
MLFAAVHESGNGMARPCSCPARRKVLRGLRSTRSTSHVTQIRVIHRRWHDRHRSRHAEFAIATSVREEGIGVPMIHRPMPWAKDVVASSSTPPRSAMNLSKCSVLA